MIMGGDALVQMGAQAGGEGVLGGGKPHVVGVQPHEVHQVQRQLFLHPGQQLLAFHREASLDALVEVALHPVGARHVHLVLAAVVEVEHSRMLQKAVDDAAHADVRRQPRHPRAQAANAAHQEVDLHPGLGGGVQRLNHLGVDEGVHLGADEGLALGGLVRRLAGDEGKDFLSEARRGHHDVVPLGRQGIAGDDVEKAADVAPEVGAGGEEADVGVDAGGAVVVVAGGEVDVAADAVVLAADDEQHLAMGLVADDAVDDVGPGGVQRPGPSDVVALVEAGAQLHQRRHLLALAGGVDEPFDEA